MIHEDKNGECVISAHQAWRPGAFESKRAAWHGQRLTDEQIQRLQDAAIAKRGIGSVITLEEVKSYDPKRTD